MCSRCLAEPLLERISPELVLVDPALRARLGCLPATPTYARSERPRAVEVPVQAPLGPAAATLAAPRSLAPGLAKARRAAKGTGALIAGIAVGLCGFALLFEGTGSGARTGPGALAPLAPSLCARPASLPVPKLAWAPEPGATAYDLELYKGGAPICGVYTSRASVVIRTESKAPRASVTVGPGVYEWYVWPFEAGQRAASPIVRSQLVIPAR
jgi:hypothetical protein